MSWAVTTKIEGSQVQVPRSSTQASWRSSNLPSRTPASRAPTCAVFLSRWPRPARASHRPQALAFIFLLPPLAFVYPLFPVPCLPAPPSFSSSWSSFLGAPSPALGMYPPPPSGPLFSLTRPPPPLLARIFVSSCLSQFPLFPLRSSLAPLVYEECCVHLKVMANDRNSD